MIYLTADGFRVTHTKHKFSGGEIQVRITSEPFTAFEMVIVAHIANSDDLMETLLLANAAKAHFMCNDITLECAYLPYARQDRICYPGEANALDVIGAVINTAGFTEVSVIDVHSGAALHTVNNLVNVLPTWFMRRREEQGGDSIVVVAPDKGARVRATAMSRAGRLSSGRVLTAEKVRDPNTGDILRTVVPDISHIGNSTFLMVDDICDGGRTFIELAKVLRQYTTGRVELFVSHGIFSQGFDAFRGMIDSIYTCNSFVPDLPEDLFPKWMD